MQTIYTLFFLYLQETNRIQKHLNSGLNLDHLLLSLTMDCRNSIELGSTLNGLPLQWPTLKIWD